jgi:cycloartenol synthase
MIKVLILFIGALIPCHGLTLPKAWAIKWRLMNDFTPLINRTSHLISLLFNYLFNWARVKSYERIIFVIVQEDLYYPHPLVQDILWASLHKFVEPIFMNWPGKKLREKAVETVMEHIHYEDENTRYICIGPVNKVILRRGKLLWGLPSIVNCLLLSALWEGVGEK